MSTKPLFLSFVFFALALDSCTLKAQPNASMANELGSRLVSKPSFSENGATEAAIKLHEPKGILTLRETLSLSLAGNPTLAMSSREMEARNATRIQAALFPNPELNIEIENFSSRSRAEQMETTISLGQQIEMGDKRSKREKVASLNHDLAGWDYESLRLDLFKEVTKHFISVLGTQQKVSLFEDLLKLAKQVSETVEKRVEAGKVSPVEEIRAKVVLASAWIDLERVKKTLSASRHILALMWGSTVPHFQSLKGSLNVPISLPSFDQLIDRLPQNPELARWDTVLAYRKSVIHLEKAQGIPDITIAGGFRQLNESDSTAFVAGISIDLPVINRNQGGIREAQLRYSKALFEQQATAIRLKATLAKSFRDLSTSHAIAEGLKTDLLPNARKTFDAVNEGYRLGKFDLLNVLDAQRTLFDARAQYIQVQIDHHKSIADVEHLIGLHLKGRSLNSRERIDSNRENIHGKE